MLNKCLITTEPSVPVGVASSSQHAGTQLVELSPTGKDYIAVAEEVTSTCM